MEISQEFHTPSADSVLPPLEELPPENPSRIQSLCCICLSPCPLPPTLDINPPKGQKRRRISYLLMNVLNLPHLNTPLQGIKLCPDHEEQVDFLINCPTEKKEEELSCKEKLTNDLITSLADIIQLFGDQDLVRFRNFAHAVLVPAHVKIDRIPGDVSRTTILIPEDLIPTFLKSVKHNTNNNIESIGFLYGALDFGGKLVLKKLVIPQQTGTFQTVQVSDVAEPFECLKELKNLSLLGWIHTHPCHVVYLSSIDMHTQYIYQKGLSEFLAIVCSPKSQGNKIGILQLSEKGMKAIEKCSLNGENFHEHSHKLAEKAKHYKFDGGKNVILIDLRAHNQS